MITSPSSLFVVLLFLVGALHVQGDLTYVVQVVDPTGYWYGIASIIDDPSQLAPWVSNLLATKAEIFDKFSPNVMLKLGDIPLDQDHQTEILDSIVAGVSPANSPANAFADYLSQTVCEQCDGLWFLCGIDEVVASIVWLNQTLRATATFLADRSPPAPASRPFALGFSGMGPIVNFLGQQGFTRSIHGFFLDQYISYSQSPYTNVIPQVNYLMQQPPYNVQFVNVQAENAAALKTKTVAGYVTGGLMVAVAEYIQQGLIHVNNQTILLVEAVQLASNGNEEALAFFETFIKPGGVRTLPVAVLVGYGYYQNIGNKSDWDAWWDSVIATAAQMAQPFGIPVFSGLQIGHDYPNYALPLGLTSMTYFSGNGTLSFWYH